MIQFQLLLEKKWDAVKAGILSKKIDYELSDDFGHLLLFLSTASDRNLFSEYLIDDISILVQILRRHQNYHWAYFHVILPYELFAKKFPSKNEEISLDTYDTYLGDWYHASSTVRRAIQSFLLWCYPDFTLEETLRVVRCNIKVHQHIFDLLLLTLKENIDKLCQDEFEYLDRGNDVKDVSYRIKETDNAEEDRTSKQLIEVKNVFYTQLFKTYRNFVGVLYDSLSLEATPGNENKQLTDSNNTIRQLINLENPILSKLSQEVIEVKISNIKFRADIN